MLNILKSNSSAWTINGPNTYTGFTTVNGGTLTYLTPIGSAGALTVTSPNFGPSPAVVLNLAKTADTAVGSLSGVVNDPSDGNSATINTGNAGTSFIVNQSAFSEYDGAIAGGGNFTMAATSSGALTLGGANTYSGATSVLGGALTILGQLGSTTAPLVVSNLNIGSATAVSLTLTSTANTTVGSLSGVLNTANAGTNTSAITNAFGYDFTVNQTTAGAFAGSINGGGNFVLGSLSTAPLTLTGASSISGSLAVNGGGLVMNGSFAAALAQLNNGASLSGNGTVAAPLTVGNGGILTAGYLGSGTLTVNGLTFGTASTDTSSVNATIGANPALINVAGDVNAISGVHKVTINVGVNGAAGIGEYPLIDYSGSLTGTGSGAFVLGSLPPRTIAHLDFSNAGVIDYDVTSIDHPVWTGSASSTWSTAAIANPKNWKLAISGSATDFITGDSVVFDDTAHTGAVQISAANVQPANVTFNNNSLAYTISGAFGIADFSGSQATSLTLSGSGLVALANTNSYTGGTLVNAGTLQLGNGTANGSVVGSVIDSSVVAFNPGTTGTLAAVISGSGAVEMGGSGRMILIANSLYTGGTTINSGTLQLGNGVVGGSIAGSVVNNGVLAFNEPAAAEFDNAVSGAGALAQIGTNVLTLAGSSYAGTILINAGTLSIGNGGSGELVGSSSIVNSAALVFNHADTTTYAGNINGPGTLTKIGAGTTVLTGSNTYTGLTTLAAGVVNLASEPAARRRWKCHVPRRHAAILGHRRGRRAQFGREQRRKLHELQRHRGNLAIERKPCKLQQRRAIRLWRRHSRFAKQQFLQRHDDHRHRPRTGHRPRHGLGCFWHGHHQLR